MNRIVLAAIAGGMVLFAWGAVFPRLLPEGAMGPDRLPVEQAVMSALSEAPRGVYMIPGEPGEAKEGPGGFIVYHPRVPYRFTPRQLVRQLLGDLGAALIAAFVLASTAGTPARRVAIAAAIGLIGWFSISVPSWNWLHFPAGYVLAEGIDQVVGWSLAGAAMSFLLPSPPGQRS